MEVPFFDLTRQNALLKEPLNAAVQEVIDSGQFLNGTYLSKFEEDWSQYLGVNHAVGVANGTDAIFLTLKALGVGPGDQVVTTAVSWVSTASAIISCGAEVVYADVDESGLIDLDRVEGLIGPRTKALLVVHLFGQMVDVQKAKQICDNHGLHLIEDAAQAHGAKFEGVSPGQMSSAATYSFYPTKNLGALGDAGAVVMQDQELALQVRKLANQGGLTKYDIEEVGVTSRMDEVQAAILSTKLHFLPQWNARRVDINSFYRTVLGEIESLQLPFKDSSGHHVYHQFVIRSTQRDLLKDYLKKKGVQTDIHYPTPLPMYSALQTGEAKGSDVFCGAMRFCSEALSLPVFPELKDAELDYVTDCILEFFANP
jgi:dTDP-4-amino-4,6-dideoxygalactose transaminase